MIEQVGSQQFNPLPNRVDSAESVIEIQDLKAILYLGLRGEIALPFNEHEVDILA